MGGGQIGNFTGLSANMTQVEDEHEIRAGNIGKAESGSGATTHVWINH